MRVADGFMTLPGTRGQIGTMGVDLLSGRKYGGRSNIVIGGVARARLAHADDVVSDDRLNDCRYRTVGELDYHLSRGGSVYERAEVRHLQQKPIVGGVIGGGERHHRARENGTVERL